MNYTQILKTCPFFAGLSDIDIEALMGIARVRESSRGELLFSDGEKAVGFFVVLAALVSVAPDAVQAQDNSYEALKEIAIIEELVMMPMRDGVLVATVAPGVLYRWADGQLDDVGRLGEGGIF